jgi:hypothetical protein
MPTTVFFASNRILTGDPAIVASYGPNIQPPSVSTEIMYGTAFVDGVDIKADQQGSITSIQDTNKGTFAANVAGHSGISRQRVRGSGSHQRGD